MADKTIEAHFADWHSEAFPFGYGTGEEHTLAALRSFMEIVQRDERYFYEALEEKLTPTVTWLLINMLCKLDVIEYGTSPRYGWLTPHGKALRDYLMATTFEQLLAAATMDDPDRCTPTFCNCGPQGYSKKKLCHNPFWQERA